MKSAKSANERNNSNRQDETVNFLKTNFPFLLDPIAPYSVVHKNCYYNNIPHARHVTCGMLLLASSTRDRRRCISSNMLKKTGTCLLKAPNI